MRPAAVLLALVAASCLTAISGCTHVQPLTLSSPEGRAAVTARAAAGGRAVVRLDGEPARAARELAMDADTTRWTDALSGRVRAEPTARVRSVAFRRDGRGALTGAAIGGAVGVPYGVLLAADDRGFFRFTLAEGLALGVAAGASVGALVGLMRSDRAVYRR